MVAEAVEELHEWLLDRLGDELRTVATVREDGGEVHYLREDLRSLYDRTSYSEVVHAFRESQREPPYDFEAYPLGARRAVVHHHEHARVVGLPLADDAAVALSVEPAAGPADHELVAAVQKRLDSPA